MFLQKVHVSSMLAMRHEEVVQNKTENTFKLFSRLCLLQELCVELFDTSTAVRVLLELVLVVLPPNFVEGATGCAVQYVLLLVERNVLFDTD